MEVLPTPFSLELRAFFGTRKAIGAKLRFTAAGTEHWLGVFELDRMVDEVLGRPNAALARFPQLLPFAGCGRRRTTVYLVDVTDSSVWMLDSGQDPVCLGISIEHSVVECRRRTARHCAPALARPPDVASIESSCVETRATSRRICVRANAFPVPRARLSVN